MTDFPPRTTQLFGQSRHEAVPVRSLSRSAKQLATKLGVQLQDIKPLSRRDGDGPRPQGYLHLTWRLVDRTGSPWGSLILTCEGGYGAGSGKAWFKGEVQLLAPKGQDAYERLVHQWDFPCDGRESAKQTRIRFVRWVERFMPKREDRPVEP